MLKKLIAQLRLHEGVSKTFYKCTAGKWTIGAGNNIQDRGMNLREVLNCFPHLEHHEALDFAANGFTEEEFQALHDQGYEIDDKAINLLLNNEIVSVLQSAEFNFGWFSSMNGARQAVVADMMFNM